MAIDPDPRIALRPFVVLISCLTAGVALVACTARPTPTSAVANSVPPTVSVASTAPSYTAPSSTAPSSTAPSYTTPSSTAPSREVPSTAQPPSRSNTAAPPATTTPARSSSAAAVSPVLSPASAVPSVAAAGCPLPASGFDCDFQRRIVAAQAYAQSRPGTVGIVLRDRQTGAVWRNGYADTRVWTASTIKLAMTVDLYTRQSQGLISLTPTDGAEIQAMLHSSDDNAADALWFRYAGADHFAYNNRFPAYGMTSLQPQAGFTNYFPYWGFQECTPNDLDRLMQYVLTKLPASERDYIVTQLQHVDADQQWGVWGAGPAAAPGNKDGWSQEASGWVLNSVGFVGPGQRYTLAIMNSLNGQGDYDDGTTTDSTVARLLFAGRF